MGSLKFFIAAGAVAFSVSTGALAADLLPPPPVLEAPPLRGTISSGLYLRGDVGVGVSNYDNINVLVNGRTPTDPVVGATSFSTVKNKNLASTTFGAGIGYQFNNWFRVDLTGERRGTTLTGRDNIGYPSGVQTVRQTNSYRSDVATFAVLANAYVDLGTWNCLTPYLGAGIGFANHSSSGFSDNGIQNFYNAAGAQTAATTSYAFADTRSKTNLAWALMAGVSYDVNANLKLELGYRYLNMGDGPVNSLRGGSAQLLGDTVQFKKMDSHDFRLGMRWTFGDPNCCSTAPAPQPVAYAPPPQPMPMVRKY